MTIETTTNYPEMCECGRMFIDRRDKDGKMMCAACYTGLSLDDLRKLWSSPIPKDFKEILNISKKD